MDKKAKIRTLVNYTDVHTCLINNMVCNDSTHDSHTV